MKFKVGDRVRRVEYIMHVKTDDGYDGQPFTIGSIVDGFIYAGGCEQPRGHSSQNLELAKDEIDVRQHWAYAREPNKEVYVWWKEDCDGRRLYSGEIDSIEHNPDGSVAESPEDDQDWRLVPLETKVEVWAIVDRKGNICVYRPTKRAIDVCFGGAYNHPEYRIAHLKEI